MQLPLTAETIAALGAGVAVLAALLLLVRFVRRRKRTDDAPEPIAADWTGEAATADPPAAARMTVAQAVAGRDAGTATRPAEPAAEHVVEPAAPRDSEEPAAAVEPSMAEVPAEGAPAPAEHPDDGGPGTADQPVPGRHTADHAGSDRAIAAAVAHAFAVRAAAGRQPERSQGGPDRSAAQPRGDARDRLLAVLLEDPVSAVGATMELEACRSQLDRLSDAMRHERGVLSDILARLADTGLNPEQLARLAGLPIEEVRAMVPRFRARESR